MNNRTDYFSYLATKYRLKWSKYSPPCFRPYVTANHGRRCREIFSGDFHETLFYLHTRLIAHKTKMSSLICSERVPAVARMTIVAVTAIGIPRGDLLPFEATPPLFPRYRAPLWTTRGGVWLRVRARAKTPHSAFPRKPGVSSRRCGARVATRREKTERKRDKSGRQKQQQ